MKQKETAQGSGRSRVKGARSLNERWPGEVAQFRPGPAWKATHRDSDPSEGREAGTGSIIKCSAVWEELGGLEAGKGGEEARGDQVGTAQKRG